MSVYFRLYDSQLPIQVSKILKGIFYELIKH